MGVTEPRFVPSSVHLLHPAGMGIERAELQGHMVIMLL